MCRYTLPVVCLCLHCHQNEAPLVNRNSLRKVNRYCSVNMILRLVQWHIQNLLRCTSGCVVECRTCNREVAGSNLDRGYFAPKSTQPSIPPGSVNEYQLRLGRQRQVWLIPLADEMQGVQVKLWYPLTMRAIPEHLKRRFTWRRYTNPLPLPSHISVFIVTTQSIVDLLHTV